MTVLNNDEESLLAEICKRHDVEPSVLKSLLDLERDLFGMGRRHGIHQRIGEILEKATGRK